MAPAADFNWKGLATGVDEDAGLTWNGLAGGAGAEVDSFFDAKVFGEAEVAVPFGCEVVSAPLAEMGLD